MSRSDKDNFYVLFFTVIVVGAIIGLFLLGQGKVDKDNFYEVCLDGVVYYHTTSKLAPAFNRDSTVKVCE